MNTQGLILFAHGARDARWAAPFEAVVRQIQMQRPQLQLRLAFLEFMAPNLHDAAAALAAAGCSAVEVLPLFLGTGGHLRKDLPPMVDRLRQQFPAVRWTLHAAVGEHDAVMQAMAAAALALLPESSPRGPST
ncbi:MAG: sirohydrochlorin chelatase [Rubrivivax sp.]